MPLWGWYLAEVYRLSVNPLLASERRNGIGKAGVSHVEFLVLFEVRAPSSKKFTLEANFDGVAEDDRDGRPRCLR